MSKEYMTVEEVAHRLGVNESRVRALIRAKKIPAERMGRRVLLIKVDDLVAFEATRNRKAGRPPKSNIAT